MPDTPLNEDNLDNMRRELDYDEFVEATRQTIETMHTSILVGYMRHLRIRRVIDMFITQTAII